MYKYGIEIELVDFDRKKVILPTGCKFSTTEIDLVNSDGRAVNPYKDSDYTIGGEVQTPPTETIDEQVVLFQDVIDNLKGAKVNYRCQLHTHISRAKPFTLDECKKMLTYVQNNHEAVNKYVWKMHTKIPEMNNSYFSAAVSKVFHMPDYMYQFCIKAKTMDEFRKCWFMSKAYTNSPLIFKRYYVNVYSIFKHGTIEWRVFRPTTDYRQVYTCLQFSQEFLEHALGDHLPVEKYVKDYDFPEPLPFIVKLENGYQNTKVTKKH